jgi:diguanylate cyclase (GGDEF)-like protein
MKQRLSLKKQPAADKTTILTIRQQINLINFRRSTYFFVAMTIIEPFLIGFFDIRNLLTDGPYGAGLYLCYLALHSLLWLMALSWVLFRKRLLQKWGSTDFFIPLVAGALLLILSLINGLDQLHGDAITVYIANLLLVGAALLIRFPLNLYIMLPSYLTFLGSMVFFQGAASARFGNLINGSIFTLGVLVVSTYLYRTHFDSALKTEKLELANKKLNYLSTHDALTGLLNRREFENRLSAMTDQPVVLVLLDIDHFKKINDSLGHTVGDQVLMAVSRILTDTVPEGFITSRWGGEEFLIAGAATSFEVSLSLAETIREAIEIHDFPGHGKLITASFGVALMAGDFDHTFDDSFREADEALYRAKTSGRNRVSR